MHNSGKDFNVSLQIASLPVTIRSQHPGLVSAVRQQYRTFLSEGVDGLPVDVIVKSKTLESDRMGETLSFLGNQVNVVFSGCEGILEPSQARLVSEPDHLLENLEYFLRIVYALLAYQAGGLMIHAAGIIHHDNGYLFFGHSGSGKTTIARLSAPDLVLNDDLVIVLPIQTGKGWSIHSTPFWNPSQVRPSLASSQLSGIFHLVKDTINQLAELPSSQALAELAACIPVITQDPERAPWILDRLLHLIRAVPVYQLSFSKSADFWKLIETMQIRT